MWPEIRNGTPVDQNRTWVEQNRIREEQKGEAQCYELMVLSYSIVCFFEVHYGKGWYYIALYGTLWYPMSMVLFGECLLYVQSVYHYIEGAINM